MTDMPVFSKKPRDLSYEKITLHGPVKTGGEGSIYLVREKPGVCAKIYLKDKLTEELKDKITAMILSPPGDELTGEKESQRSSSISWPISLLYDSDRYSGKFIGYLMPLIDTKMFREIHRYYDTEDRLKMMGGAFSWLYLMTAAFNIAYVVDSVHKKGHRIGDISASNILLARTAAIALIDCDSFQIKDSASGRMYYCKVATGDFLPPELMGRNFRTENIDRYYSDLFGLGIVIFKLLMNGFHPYQARGPGVSGLPTIEQKIKNGSFAYTGKFNGVYPPKTALPYNILTPELQKLFVRCFIDGHRRKEARPTASEWASALKDAVVSLKQCSANGNHWFSGTLSVCPWCALKGSKNIHTDFFPPSASEKPNIAAKACPTAKTVLTAFSHPAKIPTPVLLVKQKNASVKLFSTGAVMLMTPPPEISSPVPDVNQPRTLGQTVLSSFKEPASSSPAPSALVSASQTPSETFPIIIENSGDGILTGEVIPDSSWIVVNNPKFSVPKAFVCNISIDASKLSPRKQDMIHTGCVRIKTNGGTAAVVIDVRCANDPVLNVSAGRILLKDIHYGDRVSCQLVVENTGDDILTGTIQSDTPWLIPVPQKISADGRGGKQKIVIQVDSVKMPKKVLVFGKLRIKTNGGDAVVTAGATLIFKKDE